MRARSKRRRNWISLLLTGMLCSCASPYHPFNSGVGYSDTRLGADRFRVSFQGDESTSLEQANDLALLRGAEVAKAHGFDYFAVVNTENLSSVTKRFVPGQSYVTQPAFGAPGAANQREAFVESFQVVHTPAHEELSCRPGVSLEIQCYHQKPDKTFTYEAAEVARSLRKKHRL